MCRVAAPQARRVAYGLVVMYTRLGMSPQLHVDLQLTAAYAEQICFQ